MGEEEVPLLQVQNLVQRYPLQHKHQYPEGVLVARLRNRKKALKPQGLYQITAGQLPITVTGEPVRQPGQMHQHQVIEQYHIKHHHQINLQWLTIEHKQENQLQIPVLKGIFQGTLPRNQILIQAITGRVQKQG